MKIIKRIVVGNKQSWDSKLKFALRVDKIISKQATGKSSFHLVYGMEVTFPIHLKIPVYQLLQHLTSNEEAIQDKINQLIELDEKRRAFYQLVQSQKQVKETFDSKAHPRELKRGYLVLM